MARVDSALAELAEAGGKWAFKYLADMEGNLINAKPIHAKFGMCWMILDESNKATGQFAPYHPKKSVTLSKRGYQEVEVERDAVVCTGDGGGYNIRVYYWPVEWLNK